MSFEEDFLQHARVVEEQAHAKAQIRKYTKRWFELERERRKLVRAIDRSTQRILRTMVETRRGAIAANLSAEIVHEVEDRLNAEGVMEDLIRARFENESRRSTGEGPWTDLKPTTIKAREREGYGAGPILFNTGALKTMAQQAVAGTFKMNFEEIEWPDIDEIGLEYAAAMNFGYAAGGIPARPFFSRPTRAEMKPIYFKAQMILRQIMRQRQAEVEQEVANK